MKTKTRRIGLIMSGMLLAGLVLPAFGQVYAEPQAGPIGIENDGKTVTIPRYSSVIVCFPGDYRAVDGAIYGPDIKVYCSGDTDNARVSIYVSSAEDPANESLRWDHQGPGVPSYPAVPIDLAGSPPAIPPFPNPVKYVRIEANYGTITLDAVEAVNYTAPASENVLIDIKPGSYPNPINQGSNGLIPVAILTTETFDASTVDAGTVYLNGAKVAVRGRSEKLMAHLEDVDGDGDIDLLLQVETQSDGVQWTSGVVTLTGTATVDGQSVAIQGTDDVVIVPPQ